MKNRIETKPKQRYTEETILTAMENAGMKDFKNIDGVERVGLGTGATRAAIIDVLIQRGYVERRKKLLYLQNVVYILLMLYRI